MLFIIFTAMFFLTILIFILVKNYNLNKNNIVKQFLVLGTIIRLNIYGKNADAAIDKAIDKLNEIDDKMSAFKPYSEISKINKAAGLSYQKVSKDTFNVIEKALYYCEILEGTFDITIRPLVSLWNIGSIDESIPNEMQIQEAKKLVNYKDIILDKENISIKLKKENQAIDLGGIAKGYAADIVKEILLENKIKSAIIDLGGNIYALGRKPNKDKWTIGIQNPISNQGDYVGFINVENKSIVTSGNYERYFIKDGKRYHHIIDPRTGYPSESKIISVTIISDNSIDGDGLSTGTYILGVEKGLCLTKSINGIDAIFITNDKKIYITDGIKNNFKLINKEFEILNS